MSTDPIGIFDSGVGGLTVMKALTETLSNENYIYIADSKNAPYGEKSEKEIISLTQQNIDFLLSENCKLIVIACNTATGISIDYLRKTYPEIPFVGLEPAIKPACLKTKTGNIGVLATEGTFKGRHFIETSLKYKDYVNIISRAGYKLAQKVEDNTFNDDEAFKLIEEYLSPMIKSNIDYLVLGCTHYPFYLETINKITGDKINIIESGEAVARRTKDILMIHKLLNTSENVVLPKFYTSGKLSVLKQLIISYLKLEAHNFVIREIL
jgi:glutamate racemase